MRVGWSAMISSTRLRSCGDSCDSSRSRSAGLVVEMVGVHTGEARIAHLLDELRAMQLASITPTGVGMIRRSKPVYRRGLRPKLTHGQPTNRRTRARRSRPGLCADVVSLKFKSRYLNEIGAGGLRTERGRVARSPVWSKKVAIAACCVASSARRPLGQCVGGGGHVLRGSSGVAPRPADNARSRAQTQPNFGARKRAMFGQHDDVDHPE